MSKTRKFKLSKDFRVKQENTMYRQWTDTARDCYRKKCNCLICDLQCLCKKQAKDNPYNITPMKYAVLKLVEKFGKP